MDPREARFLASQAERLSSNGKRQIASASAEAADGPPELVNDIDANEKNCGVGSNTKEQSHIFWKNFRATCSEFHRQIDSLLLIPSPSTSGIIGDITSSSSGSGDDKNISNYDNAKAYYATASKRNEGRVKLDSILNSARLLQRHALSSSSSVLATSSVSSTTTKDHDVNSDNINEGNNHLLQAILSVPMPDVTQTDVRLLSQEIDGILKYIDTAREIVCPKEKFVFKRYRLAMEERGKRLDSGGNEGVIETNNNSYAENSSAISEGLEKKEIESNNNDLRSKYGGVLENKSHCTVEISSTGTVIVNETTDAQLKHYTSPRGLIHSKEESSSSSSYLVQNLQNVTLILHGTHPSLHFQHITNCQIYVTQPTLGPVHVTNCTSSTMMCSCYQLRIHDSNDVKFNVWVRSGPIIEDCNGMVFEGNYYSDDGNDVVGRNMFWDVKDFNWLRALRKSPNFTVIAKKTVDVNGKDEKIDNGMTATNDEVAQNAMSGVVPVVPGGDEDSEDEL